MYRPDEDQKREKKSQRDQHQRKNSADPVEIRRERFRAAQQHEAGGTKPKQVDSKATEQYEKKDARTFHLNWNQVASVSSIEANHARACNQELEQDLQSVHLI